jgi:hypothetical protein
MALKPNNPWYQEITRLPAAPYPVVDHDVPPATQNLPFRPASNHSRHLRTPSPSADMQYRPARMTPDLFEGVESKSATSLSYHARPGPPSYVQENIYGPFHGPSKLQLQSCEQEVDECPRSPSVSSNAGDESEEDELAMLDEALDFARHRYAPFPPTYTSRLRRPVAIPQVSPKMNSPFVRAYSEVLSAHSTRIEELC